MVRGMLRNSAYAGRAVFGKTIAVAGAEPQGPARRTHHATSRQDH